MSKVYKCDRCGEFFGTNCDDMIKVNITDNEDRLVKLVRVGGYNDLDICPNCYVSLRRWWYENDIIINTSVEDTILGRTEDITDPHPGEVKS